MDLKRVQSFTLQMSGATDTRLVEAQNKRNRNVWMVVSNPDQNLWGIVVRSTRCADDGFVAGGAQNCRAERNAAGLHFWCVSVILRRSGTQLYRAISPLWLDQSHDRKPWEESQTSQIFRVLSWEWASIFKSLCQRSGKIFTKSWRGDASYRNYDDRFEPSQ